MNDSTLNVASLGPGRLGIAGSVADAELIGDAIAANATDYGTVTMWVNDRRMQFSDGYTVEQVLDGMQQAGGFRRFLKQTYEHITAYEDDDHGAQMPPFDELADEATVSVTLS